MLKCWLPGLREQNGTEKYLCTADAALSDMAEASNGSISVIVASIAEP